MTASRCPCGATAAVSWCLVSRPVAPRLVLIGWIERRSRRQFAVGVAVVAALALWWAVRRIADLIVDRWWLDAATDASVWSTRFAAQVWLVVLTVAVVGGLVGSTTWLVLRSSGQRPMWLERYHQRMGPAHRWMLVAVAAVVVWRFTTGATSRWQEWILFWNATDLDRDVPVIGGDLGDHLFRLPFTAAALDGLRLVLVLCLAIAVVGHLLSGALTWPHADRRIAPVATAHLALLTVALLTAQALHTVLVDRASLAVDRTGRFDGPGFVQANVTMPGLWLLAVASLALAGAIVDAVRRRRGRPVAVAGLAWLALHGLVLVAAPRIVDTLVVAPAEGAREIPYLEHNLDATTAAYRLDLVDQSEAVVSDGLDALPTPEQIAAVDRVPVFDAEQLVQSFQVLQGTPATRVHDIDLDRYALADGRRPVLVATRDASRRDLPERGWAQSTLVYTHGDGVVVAPADTTSSSGRPDLTAARDLRPVRDEIYHGEGLDGWYVIVGTERPEQDGARFDADTGIALDGAWRRLVVSLSLGDHEPFFSSELTAESQLLMRRGLHERLTAIAPFLSFDGDPYAAVVDDRIVWIVDAYTTSSTYPYAQFAPHTGLAPGSDLAARSFNYLQASVRAVVDAYSGEVTLYRTETIGDADPILELWDGVLPGLFRPADEMPGSVRAHVRYPADLLTVQSNLLGRYHVDDADMLFDGTDRWSVSTAPASEFGTSPAITGAPTPASRPTTEVMLFSPDGQPDGGAWVSIQTFSPGAASNPNSTRDSLAAYAIADHDTDRMRLVQVASGTGRQITSPRVAQSAIDADPDLAREFALLTSNGSRVSFGPMTLVPFDDSIVWIRPVIVAGTAAGSTPHLYKVLAVSNGTVGEGTTAGEALTDAVRQSLSPSSP